MNWRDILLLFGLAALWGSSFLFIRVAVPALNPAPLVEARVAIAGIALIVYAVWSSQKFSFRKYWRQFLILGALNAAIPFTLVAFATLTITASLAAILNAATPLFTVVLSAWWLKEKLTTKKVTGAFLGITGVLLIVGFDSISGIGSLIAIGAALLAPLSYAGAAVYAKKVSLQTSPLAMAIGQQLAAAILLLPLATITLPTAIPSLPVTFAVLALALFSTALGYLIFYRLIERVGPTNTISVTLLVPIFGMLWGVLILGEAVTFIQVAGLLVILFSLVLITNISLKRNETVPLKTN